MALSATFTANFASFYDAVDKADAKLKDFGAGADKVGGRLNTLANQFSGQKIVQEATIMAKAVEEIGGVSKLTEKELARLGATTNEAVAKMKALGMDVPKNLQKIADQTKDANRATSDWSGTLTKMAGVVAATFSIGAITNFIGGIFDAASAVKDLSDQWGVSTTAVQKWTGAAKQSGVEAETVGKSVQYLTEQLAEGSDQYKALLENVGLSYDELRKMPLEEAYNLVIKAIAGIKDETLQLDVAQGLLGASSKKMVGAIRDGFLEATEAQKIMSEETIKRLEAAQGQWEKFKNAVVTYSGEMLGSVMSSAEKMTASWGQFFKTMGIAIAKGPIAAVKDLNTTFEPIAGFMDETTNKSGILGAAFGDLGAQSAGVTGKIKTQAEVTADLKAKSEALKKAEAERAKGLEEAKKAQEEHTKKLEAQDRAMNALINTFSGGDLIGKANQYIDALKMAIPIEQMTAAAHENINKVMTDAIKVYEAMGQKAPQVMYDIQIATNTVAEKVKIFQAQIGELLDPGWWKPAAPIDLGQIITLPDAPKPGLFDDFGKEISSALSGSILRAIEGGGDVFRAIGSTIGNYLLDPKQSYMGKAIEEQTKKLPGVLGSAISGALPVVGSLIGPAVSWLGGKIAGLFGKKEHEKLRESFIQAAGGIDPLIIAAEKAGVSLDQLMRARNTDAMKKAIGELEEAFAFQKTALDQAMEAAQRYGFTLEELGPALAAQELDKQAQQLYKDWQVLNSAGLDTVAITERMSDEVSDYVNKAVAMGSEIPAAMRPMLESMARAGTLVDENGDAITDLEAAGISFALTMSDGFKALIDEVRLLTDAIGRSLGLAIKNIPQPKVRGEVTWDVKEIHAPPSTPSGEELESYQKGTEGFRNFGAGTPVMLHGWEAVVPREKSEAFATVTPGGGAAAGAMPTIVINAQGAFFDTPESLQRLATKVSDALTAKYSVMGKLRAAV